MRFIILFSLLYAGLLSHLESPASPRGQSLADAVIGGSERFWRSIGTLQFVCEEYVATPAGEPAPGTARVVYELAINAEGESAVLMAVHNRDGSIRRTETRLTLDKQHKINYDLAGAPEIVQTTPRSVDADSYGNDAFSATWLLWPAKRRLDALLRDGATCEPVQVDGSDLVQVRASFRGNPVLILCNPAYDHAIQRVQVGGDNGQVFRVDKFQEVDGRWLPEAGRMGPADAPDDSWMRFKVSQVRINAEIEPARFGLPSLPDGAIHSDQVEGRSTVVGKRRARDAGPEPTSPPGGLPGSAKILVSPRRPWAWYVAGSAAVLLVVALVVLRRRLS